MKMNHPNNIKKATQEEHDAAIALMRTFMDSDKPKVGIFWYNFVNKSLFGVSKIEAESLSAEGDIIKYSQTHDIYCEEQHVLGKIVKATPEVVHRFRFGDNPGDPSVEDPNGDSCIWEITFDLVPVK